MATENLNDFLYFTAPAIEMNQNKVKFFLLTLNVFDLLRVSAFKPAEYNSLEERYIEVSLTEQKITPQELIRDNSDADFNRELDNVKLNSIYDYANNNSDAIFPNSLILASHWKEYGFFDDIKGNPKEFSDDQINDFNSVNGVYFDSTERLLYIPILDQSILIVDGQHRLAGLAKLDEEDQKRMMLPITLVVGESNAVLSNMFYKINSTQKPVNTSVLKYMTNLFLTDFNEAKMFQEYIRVLNDNVKSPLNNQIKMFGTGEGLISFGTFHDNLMSMTLMASNRSKKIPIFRPLFENENLQFHILNLLVFYFSSLKMFVHTEGDDNEWNKGVVFTKTIGIVALLQLLPRIILKIICEKYNIETAESLTQISQDDFEGVLISIKDINVEKYQGAGSMGVSKTLREELVEVLQLDQYDDMKAKQTSWLVKCYK